MSGTAARRANARRGGRRGSPARPGSTGGRPARQRRRRGAPARASAPGPASRRRAPPGSPARPSGSRSRTERGPPAACAWPSCPRSALRQASVSDPAPAAAPAWRMASRIARRGRMETPSSTSRRSTSARTADGSCRATSRTSAGAVGSRSSSRSCTSWTPMRWWACRRSAPATSARSRFVGPQTRPSAAARAASTPDTIAAGQPEAGSTVGRATISTSARSSGGAITSASSSDTRPWWTGISSMQDAIAGARPRPRVGPRPRAASPRANARAPPAARRCRQGRARPRPRAAGGGTQLDRDRGGQREGGLRSTDATSAPVEGGGPVRPRQAEARVPSATRAATARKGSAGRPGASARHRSSAITAASAPGSARSWRWISPGSPAASRPRPPG